MTLAQALSTCFRKYTDFSGRAARPEYWWWALAAGVVTIIAVAFGFTVRTSVYPVVWSLVILLPTLAVSVRRLRDAGQPWPWVFLLVVPLLGTIALLVLLAQPTRAARTA